MTKFVDLYHILIVPPCRDRLREAEQGAVVTVYVQSMCSPPIAMTLSGALCSHFTTINVLTAYGLYLCTYSGRWTTQHTVLVLVEFEGFYLKQQHTILVLVGIERFYLKQQHTILERFYLKQQHPILVLDCFERFYLKQQNIILVLNGFEGFYLKQQHTILVLVEIATHILCKLVLKDFTWNNNTHLVLVGFDGFYLKQTFIVRWWVWEVSWTKTNRSNLIIYQSFYFQKWAPSWTKNIFIWHL